MRLLPCSATLRLARSGKRSATSSPRCPWTVLALPAALRGSGQQLSARRPCGCKMLARSSSCSA
eukprot:178365-Alexandrium_andersonii.AAC.1